MRKFILFMLTQDAKHFRWLAFATLLLGSFILVTSEMRATEPGLLASIDQGILQNFAAHRTPRLNGVLVDVTAMGSTTVLTLLTTAISVIAFFTKRFQLAYHLIAAGAGAGILTHFLKVLFDRTRPEAIYRIVDVDGASYPSGHSLGAAAVYFTLAIIFCAQLPKISQRLLSGSVFFAIIIAIGISRMYLGAHYFSDVVAGILVGIGWASLLAATVASLQLRNQRAAQRE